MLSSIDILDRIVTVCRQSIRMRIPIVAYAFDIDRLSNENSIQTMRII